MKVPCGICKTENDRQHCKVIKLTEAEKALLPDPKDEFFYCNSCFNIMSDPVAGPALMKGLAQIKMTQLGVTNAAELATKFHNRLLERTKVRS